MLTNALICRDEVAHAAARATATHGLEHVEQQANDYEHQDQRRETQRGWHSEGHDQSEDRQCGQPDARSDTPPCVPVVSRTGLLRGSATSEVSLFPPDDG